MEKAQPEIDTAKLRRIMNERRRAFEHCRDLADRFADIRKELQRFEAGINVPNRHIDKQARERELEQLAALKEERDQVQANREAAHLATRAYVCLENLTNYARSLGFVADYDRGVVRRRRKGEPLRVRA